MPLYRIIVATYEAATGYRYAVVTHVFQGTSPDEARRYYQSHLTSDLFLRACDPEGVFDERVRCRSEIAFEGWVDG